MDKDGLNLFDIVRVWISEASIVIKKSLNEVLIVETKTDKDDLVTNVDRWVEDFFTSKIREAFPDDYIIGEEGDSDTGNIEWGNVWVIDPIDGTTNFVKQKDNFCIMLSYFESGVGKLAVIKDVMRDNMIYGGAGIGVFYNGERITAVENKSLSQGLLGIGRKILLDHSNQVKDVVSNSLAIRIYGCTGIDLMYVLSGKTVCFMGRLAPWDYAPGVVLGNELGLKFSTFDGGYPGFKQKEMFIIGTQNAYDEAMNLMETNQESVLNA